MEMKRAKTPRDQARALERYARLPRSDVEAYAGYGVMALPFSAGHILAFRLFPEASFGGYTCVWHRTPDGRWTFYSDGDPARSCARYFGSELDESPVTDVVIKWTGPSELHVEVPEVGLEWSLTFGATVGTRLLNAAGRIVPRPLWHSKRALNWLSKIASRLLRAGKIRLTGRTPSGQEFINNPFHVWVVDSSTARFGDLDLGPTGALEPQAHLADYWLPQRGVLAYGQVLCEPMDPARHVLKSTRESAPTSRISGTAKLGGAAP